MLYKNDGAQTCDVKNVPKWIGSNKYMYTCVALNVAYYIWCKWANIEGIFI